MGLKIHHSQMIHHGMASTSQVWTLKRTMERLDKMYWNSNLALLDSGEISNRLVLKIFLLFCMDCKINTNFQVDNNRIDVSQRTASNDLTGTACRNYANDSKCIGLCFILLFILSSLLSNNFNLNINTNSPLLLKNYQSIR